MFIIPEELLLLFVKKPRRGFNCFLLKSWCGFLIYLEEEENCKIFLSREFFLKPGRGFFI